MLMCGNYHCVIVTASVNVTDIMCGSRRCLQSWHGMHHMHCLSIIYTLYIFYILLLLLILHVALEANYGQLKSTNIVTDLHAYYLLLLVARSTCIVQKMKLL